MRIGRRGGPRLLEAHQYLGLLLAWHHMRGSIALYLLIGVENTVASFYVRFARRIVHRDIVENVHDSVAMRRPGEAQQFKLDFNQRDSLFIDIYLI